MHDEVQAIPLVLEGIAYRLGRMDALLGLLCLPESYFPTEAQRTLYARGFHAVWEENKTTPAAIITLNGGTRQ